jgi:hypothetical protein
MFAPASPSRRGDVVVGALRDEGADLGPLDPDVEVVEVTDLAAAEAGDEPLTVRQARATVTAAAATGLVRRLRDMRFSIHSPDRGCRLRAFGAFGAIRKSLRGADGIPTVHPR